MRIPSATARGLLKAGQWAPVAFLGWLLAGYSLEQPIFDQWALSAFFEKVASGTAGVGDLFAYHNRVHISALPKLIHTPLAFATGWSLKAEVFLNLGLAILTFLLLRRISFLFVPQAARHRLLVPNLLTSLLLFSPVHGFDWLYGFALCIFLVNACIVAGAFALARGGGELSRRDFWLAALLCVAATLSRLDGLLAWLCLLPCLVDRIPSSSRRGEYALTWSVLTLVSWVAVLSGIDESGLGVSPAASLSGDPLGALVHAAVLLGMPLAHFVHALAPGLPVATAWAPAGFALGILFALLAGACLCHRDGTVRSRACPWVAIGLYPLLYAGMNAAGRLGKGDELFVLASMYAGVTALLPIAVVQLGAIYVDVTGSSAPVRWGRASLGRTAARAGAGALAVLLAVNYAFEVPELVEGRRTSHARRICSQIVLYLEPESTCEQIERSGMERLERLGFRQLERDLAFATSEHGAIGGIEWTGPAPGRAAPTWLVRGWVALPRESAETPGVLLSIGERKRFVAYASRSTPTGDGGRRLRWSAELPDSLLPRGRVSIRAWRYDRDTSRVVALGDPVRIR